jgi:hypothetical protein
MPLCSGGSDQPFDSPLTPEPPPIPVPAAEAPQDSPAKTPSVWADPESVREIPAEWIRRPQAFRGIVGGIRLAADVSPSVSRRVARRP